jgi:hypothetical protein
MSNVDKLKVQEKQEQLKALFLTAMQEAQIDVLERVLDGHKKTRSKSVQNAVNSVNKSVDLEDAGPDDFTPEQLSEARRLYLYEGYSDADALRKVRQDG